MQLVSVTEPVSGRWHHRSFFSGRFLGVRAGPSRDSHASEAPLELPGGAYWWIGSDRARKDFVYGNQFVISRPMVGGEGIIPASKNVQIEVYAWSNDANISPLAVYPRRQLGLALRGVVVIDTEYEFVDESGQQPCPGSECVGIVYVGNGEDESLDSSRAGRNGHPRRTQRIRFTCNLCREVNEKPINPHAWKTGSVFARCEGCDVVHKLKDNLRIFHELGGPVFPPMHLRGSLIIQDVLDKIAARRKGSSTDDNSE